MGPGCAHDLIPSGRSGTKLKFLPPGAEASEGSVRFAAGDLSGAETFLRVSGQKVALRLAWSVLGLTSSLWTDDGVWLVTELGAQEDLRVCVSECVHLCVVCMRVCLHVCVHTHAVCSLLYTSTCGSLLSPGGASELGGSHKAHQGTCASGALTHLPQSPPSASRGVTYR